MGASAERTATAAQVQKAERERTAILRAAYSLIGRGSGQAVSVQEILDATELSTRAFYRHFPSKDELILTMYRIAADRVIAELRDVMATASGPVEAFESSVRQQLAVAFDPRRAHQAAVLMSTEARAAAGCEQLDHETAAVRRGMIADVIRRGHAAGVFPLVTDPEEDARAVLGVIHGLIAARLAGHDTPDWAASTDHTVGLFKRAFGAC